MSENGRDAGTWTLPGRRFFTPLNIAVLIACAIPMGITGAMLRRPAKPPRIIKPVPKFELKNQRGETVSDRSLLGKVWIASFLFTHCPDVCPRTLQRLKGTKAWLKEKRPDDVDSVRFVGISLDHQGDTPERATTMLKAQGHEPAQWDFLLSKKTLHGLMRDGFLLGVRGGDNGLAAAHSDRVVLVGKYGKIRGYYDINSNEGLAVMHGHMDLLLAEEPPAEAP